MVPHPFPAFLMLRAFSGFRGPAIPLSTLFCKTFRIGFKFHTVELFFQPVPSFPQTLRFFRAPLVIVFFILHLPLFPFGRSPLSDDIRPSFLGAWFPRFFKTPGILFHRVEAVFDHRPFPTYWSAYANLGHGWRHEPGEVCRFCVSPF